MSDAPTFELYHVGVTMTLAGDLSAQVCVTIPVVIPQPPDAALTSALMAARDDEIQRIALDQLRPMLNNRVHFEAHVLSMPLTFHVHDEVQ